MLAALELSEESNTPGLDTESSWNMLTVSLAWMRAKANRSFKSTWSGLSGSICRPVARRIPFTACAIADCIRTPRTSSLSRPRSSTSSLSARTIGYSPPGVGCTGRRSSSVELERMTLRSLPSRDPAAVRVRAVRNDGPAGRVTGVKRPPESPIVSQGQDGRRDVVSRTGCCRDL